MRRLLEGIANSVACEIETKRHYIFVRLQGFMSTKTVVFKICCALSSISCHCFSQFCRSERVWVFNFCFV
jgi:hypothetical protein